VWEQPCDIGPDRKDRTIGFGWDGQADTRRGDVERLQVGAAEGATGRLDRGQRDLALDVVYGFARQSGGLVRIHSEVGQGTTLCLYLPRHHGAAEALGSEGEPVVISHGRQSETVLIVDDEPTVRMLVTVVLEELGYATIEAAEGTTALKVLRSNVRLDLLVTDVGLPGGMNGRQIADTARTARPGLKVQFITGDAENAAVGNGQLEPGMEVLTKPFSMEGLAARIRGILGQM